MSNYKPIVCVGYEGHVCGKLVERTSPKQKRCSDCRLDVKRLCNREWYGRNPDRAGHMWKVYREAHRELASVRNHWRVIFDVENPRHVNYEGMPFFDGWNPAKGGSFKAGEVWIIHNLGKRPEGTTLHVIDHEKGFVPGNLEWTHPRKQNNQQMFKIIADQRHEIRQLKEQIQQLKAA